MISHFFPNIRSCTTDNYCINLFTATTVKGKLELNLIKRKNSLICENKAIYILYIQNYNFLNLDFSWKFVAFLKLLVNIEI